jgi:hypothetical protein
VTALSDRLDLAVEVAADADHPVAVGAYCATCRYGVSVASPGVCPMCRGTDWVVPDPLGEIFPTQGSGDVALPTHP